MYRQENVELEQYLFARLPSKFRSHYRAMLDNDKKGYWQTISEMRTMVVFNKIGFIPQEVGVPTYKKKNVDILASCKNDQVYIEVKGFRPSNTIMRHGSVDDGAEMVSRALDRALPKFLDGTNNILVIADEETTSMSLYSNPLIQHHNTPTLWLNNPDYTKVSAIMILGSYYQDELFKYKLYLGTSAQTPLPQGVRTILNNNKTN